MRAIVKLWAWGCWLPLLACASVTEASVITNLVGGLNFSPVATALDETNAVAYVGGGKVHVVGNDSGQAARQVFDLATQTFGTVEYFDSLTGSGGSGRIRAVQQLNSGQTLYAGESIGAIGGLQPTSWLAPNAPQGGVGPSGSQVAGSLSAISDNGTFVGAVGGQAAYGTHGNLPQNLPGGGTLGATDISDDASFITGPSHLWRSNVLGGYDVFSTSGFDFSASGGLPQWVGVEIDPVLNAAVFAGEWLESGVGVVGFWREDGSFLFSGGLNSSFNGFEVYDGQLVAAVNRGLVSQDSNLFAITDGSSLSVASLIGIKNQLIARDALFVDSLGNVGLVGTSLEPAGGTFIASGTTAIPEPSPLLLVTLLFVLVVGCSLIGRVPCNAVQGLSRNLNPSCLTFGFRSLL